MWIYKVYPLSHAPEAHRALEQRETAGKLLLIHDSSLAGAI